MSYKTFIHSFIICAALFFSQDLYSEDKLNNRQTHGSVTSLSAGWNGLVGLGGIYTMNKGDLNIDAGFGKTLAGYKLGVRARHIFLANRKTSPYIGIGLLYVTQSSQINTSDSDHLFKNLRDILARFTYQVKGSPYLQLCTGVDHYANTSFYTNFSFGYSILLVENINIIHKEQPLSDYEKDHLYHLYGSGFSASLSMGVSF